MNRNELMYDAETVYKHGGVSERVSDKRNSIVRLEKYDGLFVMSDSRTRNQTLFNCDISAGTLLSHWLWYTEAYEVNR